MATEKTCFVIMPITMPPTYADRYEGNEDHFPNVYNCLHAEAVRRAGYEPIPPSAEGTTLLTARIMEQLVNADLVLCDMSLRNANVFFELGIRTAINKSVCLVVDDVSLSEGELRPPFDIDNMGREVYHSSLRRPVVDEEIEIIANHIRATMHSAPHSNPLWHHLGAPYLHAVADSDVATDSRFVRLQLDAIRRQLAKGNMIDAMQGHIVYGDPESRWDESQKLFEVRLRMMLEEFVGSTDVKLRLHIIDQTNHIGIETSAYDALDDAQCEKLGKMCASQYVGWGVFVKPFQDRLNLVGPDEDNRGKTLVEYDHELWMKQIPGGHPLNNNSAI